MKTHPLLLRGTTTCNVEYVSLYLCQYIYNNELKHSVKSQKINKLFMGHIYKQIWPILSIA